MKNVLTKLLVGSAIALTPIAAFCNTESAAREKMVQLQELTDKARSQGLDVQREECALWMADAFLGYANWDAENEELNSYQYSMWSAYKKDAKQLAADLPEFERSEVMKMLDNSIAQIERVLSGEIVRPTPVDIDWYSSEIAGDGYISNGEPFFFNTNGVPKEYGSVYHGYSEGAPLSMTMRTSEKGIPKETIKEIKKRKNGISGSVYMPHPSPLEWMKEADPTIEDGKRYFVRYDIDNPLVRESWQQVIDKIVPLYVGKSWTNYGYNLSNEPQWFLMKNEWEGGGFSAHTMAKLRVWLENKHKDIARLNELWGTSFASFADVDVELPFEGEIYGTPMIYDVMRFNQDRAMDWFNFLADGIRKHDPNAKIGVKLMPHLFGWDRRDHGLDYERITEISDVIGNDAKIVGRSVNSKYPEHWEESYLFNWHDVGVPYDFMQSVAPESANFNSESHFLSTVQFRDIKLSKEYTRACYWMATMQGMDGSSSWFWARDAKGAIKENLRAGVKQTDNAMAMAYVASFCQQPRVTNEITQTYYDMNSVSNELTAIQRLDRPIRIYYSEHSALNMLDYMASIDELYEPLFFSGSAVGFATERIIERQDNDNWDVIVVRNTPFVEESEIDALQSYLDRGGKVIIDKVSFKLNEYGEPHTKQLKASKGELINRTGVDHFVSEALEIAEKAGSMPALVVEERNSNPKSGCFWRTAQMEDGTNIMSIINIGISEATLNIAMRNGSQMGTMKNMLTGEKIENGFKMQPYDVLMVEIAK